MTKTLEAVDHQHMAHAIRLARRGSFSVHPNPAVGCVLVRDNNVIGQGWHQQAGGPHAEIAALKDAGRQGHDTATATATAYVTLEPCCHRGHTGPCTEALIEAGITTVISAGEDPNPSVSGQGHAALKAAGINVMTGILQAQAEQLNPGFIQMHRHGKPYVRLKMAMSLDGKVALANGQSQWITGSEARADGHRYRAMSCAILTGVGTVLADDPSLTVRLNSTISYRPVRVIMDRQARTPPAAKLFDSPGRICVLTECNEIEKKRALTAAGAEVVVFPKLDNNTLTQWLLDEQLHTVHVEAGPGLSGALIEAAWVDEYLIYQAPSLLGGQARSAFDFELSDLSQRQALTLMDSRYIGQDQRIILRKAEG